MSIKVKSLGLVKNEEIEIKAIASLEADGIRIDGIKINESQNGNLYLQFPERKFKKKDSEELITTKLMFADNEVFKKISETLIKAYQDKKEKGEFEIQEIETSKQGVSISQANPLQDQSKKTKAMVSIDVNGIHLKDIRLNENNQGNLYLQFPNKKTKEEEYKDMFYPTNTDLRKQLTDEAINIYQEKLMAKEFDESAKAQEMDEGERE
ncbi:septation protein SpoVG family protein [uncultured Clostridium sp.]|uniref:septation protein SpoVG family protein n=1 Tax=uncultured Clostridium sp. TaxID=59620 RepID=UPI00272ACA6D|nr:septation protein SpoVG family protein [uncultured Clostridium sp.]